MIRILCPRSHTSFSPLVSILPGRSCTAVTKTSADSPQPKATFVANARLEAALKPVSGPAMKPALETALLPSSKEQGLAFQGHIHGLSVSAPVTPVTDLGDFSAALLMKSNGCGSQHFPESAAIVPSTASEGRYTGGGKGGSRGHRKRLRTGSDNGGASDSLRGGRPELAAAAAASAKRVHTLSPLTTGALPSLWLPPQPHQTLLLHSTCNAGVSATIPAPLLYVPPQPQQHVLGTFWQLPPAAGLPQVCGGGPNAITMPPLTTTEVAGASLLTNKCGSESISCSDSPPLLKVIGVIGPGGFILPIGNGSGNPGGGDPAEAVAAGSSGVNSAVFHRQSHPPPCAFPPIHINEVIMSGSLNVMASLQYSLINKGGQ